MAIASGALAAVQFSRSTDRSIEPASRLLTSASKKGSYIVTPKEVLALCREKDVKAVDLRFMDFPGLWQHFTIPVDKLDEDVFEDGLGFDGSSIRGWQAINESDMLVVPAARDGRARSLLHAADAVDDLQHSGPDHPRGLHPRSAQRRPQGGQLSEEHRHRRHGLHRPRARVLHLRRRPLRSEHAERLLLHRQHRRPVEPRPRGEAPTWATSCATRKATSPSRPPTR